MTHCRACSERSLYYLFDDYQGGHWWRCYCCGSDSSSNSYVNTKHLYGEKYNQEHHGGISIEDELTSMRSNLDWFVDYRPETSGIDFLDVGCCRGAAMTGMQKRGFRVHGFDVTEASRQPGCSTIAPEFKASLFPQRYHAVMCREVIEHVDHQMQFITELANVTERGGFLQIQTPRPTSPEEKDNGIATNRIGYQGAHICLLSPLWMRYWLEKLGFEVKDYRMWETGQVWMTKKR